MEGLDEDWIYKENPKEVIYINLKNENYNTSRIKSGFIK